MNRLGTLLPFRTVGYIYLVRDDANRLKGGFSIDPPMRLLTHQTSNGGPLQMIAVIPGVTKADETRLHRQLRTWREAPHDQRRREWYRNTPYFWSVVRDFCKANGTVLRMIHPDQLALGLDDNDIA